MTPVETKQQRMRTTLEELEKSEVGPVWVINNTGDVLDMAANLMFSVPKINGTGTDPVRVPRTFIPLDLTQQVPKKQLMQSSEFRNTVRKGHLRLVSPEYAAAVMKLPDAQAELQRLTENMRASSASLAARTIVDTEETFDPENVSLHISKPKEKSHSIRASAPIEVSVALQTMVITSKEQKWSENRILAELRSRTNTFKDADIKFLLGEFAGLPRVTELLNAL